MGCLRGRLLSGASATLTIFHETVLHELAAGEDDRPFGFALEKLNA